MKGAKRQSLHVNQAPVLEPPKVLSAAAQELMDENSHRSNKHHKDDRKKKDKKKNRDRSRSDKPRREKQRDNSESR